MRQIHEGDLGEELAVGRVLGLQLLPQLGEGDHDPPDRLDGVDPEVGVGVPRCARSLPKG
ncbi:MAG TPA: hypothetical protein VMW27_05480 [Thermoanaerobaculia bacterium]|nr:hypothetical protein [Thermoanaerobaculia bacterium]